MVNKVAYYIRNVACGTGIKPCYVISFCCRCFVKRRRQTPSKPPPVSYVKNFPRKFPQTNPQTFPRRIMARMSGTILARRKE